MLLWQTDDVLMSEQTARARMLKSVMPARCVLCGMLLIHVPGSVAN